MRIGAPTLPLIPNAFESVKAVRHAPMHRSQSRTQPGSAGAPLPLQRTKMTAQLNDCAMTPQPGSMRWQTVYDSKSHTRSRSLSGSGKPRGYAFIEYEHKADMKEAYKAADGRKIEGRRVLVDVERGRTVEAW